MPRWVKLNIDLLLASAVSLLDKKVQGFLPAEFHLGTGGLRGLNCGYTTFRLTEIFTVMYIVDLPVLKFAFIIYTASHLLCIHGICSYVLCRGTTPNVQP